MNSMESHAEISYETAKAPHYPWITAIFAWCGLAVVSSLYITIPMVSVFASAFQAEPSQASWVSSSFSFSYAVGFLIFGTISERIGRKRIMIAGLAALSLVTPILGAAPNLEWLIGLRAIQGAAAATFAPAALSYIAEMYRPEKRVTAIGFVSTGFLMAGIIGQVFSSIVSDALSWPYVFFILGGIYFLSAVLLGGWVPREQTQRGQGKPPSTFRQAGMVLSNPSLLLGYVITVVLLLSFVGMYATLGSYLGQAPFDLSPNQILGVRSAGIAGMLTSPFAGQLANRYGTVRVLQGGLLLAAAGLGLIGLSPNLPVLVAMSILFVTGISLSVPALISLIGSLAGEARGMGVTLYTFILFIGAALGPIAATNLMMLGSYTITLEILASLLGIGMLASLFMKNQTRSN